MVAMGRLGRGLFAIGLLTPGMGLEEKVLVMFGL